MPQIGQEILDTTFYLYASVDDAKVGRKMGGTGFLVGYIPRNVIDRDPPIYAVTNWHLAVRDGFSVIRLNCHDGTTDTFAFDPSEWEFIAQGPDVAAVPLKLDPAKHKFSAVELSSFVTDSQLQNKTVETGEDLFMVGRFMDHDGGEVNLPAARFGHISVLPTRVYLKELKREEEYYCADVHSRSGYSGSPVFAYRTLASDLTGRDLRILYDEIERLARQGRRPTFRPQLGLLGIHCGQFDEKWEQRSARGSRKPSKRYLIGMSGMTLVAPAWTIQAVLDLPKFQNQRAAQFGMAQIPSAHLESIDQGRPLGQPGPQPKPGRKR